MSTEWKIPLSCYLRTDNLEVEKAKKNQISAYILLLSIVHPRKKTNAHRKYERDNKTVPLELVLLDLVLLRGLGLLLTVLFSGKFLPLT